MIATVAPAAVLAAMIAIGLAEEGRVVAVADAEARYSRLRRPGLETQVSVAMAAGLSHWKTAAGLYSVRRTVTVRPAAAATVLPSIHREKADGSS
jgi:hypothetical protein